MRFSYNLLPLVLILAAVEPEMLIAFFLTGFLSKSNRRLRAVHRPLSTTKNLKTPLRHRAFAAATAHAGPRAGTAGFPSVPTHAPSARDGATGADEETPYLADTPHYSEPPPKGTRFSNQQTGCHLIGVCRVPRAGLEAWLFF